MGIGFVCGTECSIFFSNSVDPTSTGGGDSYPAHELIRARSFSDATNSAVSSPRSFAAAAEAEDPAPAVGAAATPRQMTTGASSPSSKRRRSRQLAAAPPAEEEEEEEEGDEQEEGRYGGSNERRRRKRSSSSCPSRKSRGRKRHRHRDRDSDRPPRPRLEYPPRQPPEKPRHLLLRRTLPAQDTAAACAAVDAAAAASLGPVSDGLASPRGVGVAAAATVGGLASQVSMDGSGRFGAVDSPHSDGREMARQLSVSSDGKAPAGPSGVAADSAVEAGGVGKVAVEKPLAWAKGRGGALPAQVRVRACLRPRACVKRVADCGFMRASPSYVRVIVLCFLLCWNTESDPVLFTCGAEVGNQSCVLFLSEGPGVSRWLLCCSCLSSEDTIVPLVPVRLVVGSPYYLCDLMLNLWRAAIAVGRSLQ